MADMTATAPATTPVSVDAASLEARRQAAVTKLRQQQAQKEQIPTQGTEGMSIPESSAKILATHGAEGLAGIITLPQQAMTRQVGGPTRIEAMVQDLKQKAQNMGVTVTPEIEQRMRNQVTMAIGKDEHPWLGQGAEDYANANLASPREKLAEFIKELDIPYTIPHDASGRMLGAAARVLPSLLPSLIFPEAAPAFIGTGLVQSQVDQGSQELGLDPKAAQILGMGSSILTAPLVSSVRGLVGDAIESVVPQSVRNAVSDLVPRRNPARILSHEMAQMAPTEEEIATARAIMEDAHTMGADMSWPMAFHEATHGRAGNFLEWQRYLQGTAEGGRVMDRVMHRTGDVIRRRLGETAADAPYTPIDQPPGHTPLSGPQQTAIPYRMQTAAQQVQRGDTAARTAEVEPIYNQGQVRSLEGMSQQDFDALNGMVHGNDIMSQAWRDAQYMARNDPTRRGQQLPTWLETDANGNITGVTHLPDAQTAKYIQKSLDDIITKGRDPTTGQVTNAARVATALKDQFSAIMERNIPELRAGDVRYQELSQQRVTPTAQSPIGQTARAEPTMEAQASTLMGNNNPAEVEAAVRRLVDSPDPTVARDWLRNYIEGKVSNVRNDASPKVFLKVLAESPAQEADLLAFARASRGDDYANNLQSIIRVIRAHAKKPQVGSRTEFHGLQTEQLGNFPGKDVLNPAAWPSAVSRFIDRWINPGRLRNFSEMIMDRNNMGVFQQLRQMDPGSPNAARLLRGLLSGGAATGTELAAGR